MYRERDCARVSGISERTWRKLRHRDGIVQGTHWTTLPDGAVAWTEAGLEAALGALWLEKGEAEMPLTKTRMLAILKTCESREASADGESRISDGGARMAVWVKGTRNPHIGLATLGGRLVRVRMREHGKMRKGMELPVRAVRAEEGLYELARKCPRWNGRW